ncbi:LysE family translocator [Maritalea mediterranea]|uniref:LysE family translocator n=1 Tax=Maritalea mediterranea TaxID=2909667 RepID=A0ABS9E619_9HYPH|nr:LysE family translocator [Maritalea mediterranea]MCF4098301.1 LysE family translocator [Maritalea mediterranea]
MLDSTMLVAFITACFFLAIVPGPTITIIVANALSRGLRGGFGTILGAQVAVLLMVGIVALGLEAVIAIMGNAFIWLKLLGAAYLIYLGIKMVRNKSGLKFEADQVDGRSFFEYMLQGFLVTMANPKALLFLGAFLPQFINTAQPVAPQIMILGLITVSFFATIDSCYALAASKARNLLSTQRVALLNKMSGGFLIVGGAWLALQQKS